MTLLSISSSIPNKKDLDSVGQRDLFAPLPHGELLQVTLDRRDVIVLTLVLLEPVEVLRRQSLELRQPLRRPPHAAARQRWPLQRPRGLAVGAEELLLDVPQEVAEEVGV